MNRKSSTPVPGRTVQFVAVLLCLAGLGISIELTRIHYYTHTDPSYKSVCAVNDLVNCETVAQSPFSVFLGAPVSVWGILGYLLMSALGIWGLTGKRLHDTWPRGVLFSAITVSALASLTLGYISFLRIDSLCIFCTSLYAINLVLLILGVVLAVQSRANPLTLFARDTKAVIGKPVLLIALTVIGGGAVAALIILTPPYWQHPGWIELPRLPTGADQNGCHWIGAEDPLVTIVEFSDYQCPHCRKAHKEMRLEAAKYPDEVRLIHHHLPLDQACNEDIKKPFHNRACEFSKAAECGAAQEKFWEMNDALFSIQEHVRTADVDVELIAVQLGIDRSTFRDCMAEEGIPDCILSDIERARALNVAGTPTFYIRSQPFPGGLPEGALEAALQREREKR